MNILYDYQIFYYQRYGGISKYISNLLYALHQNKLVSINLPLTIEDNSEIDFLRSFLSPEQGYYPKRKWFNIPGKNKFKTLYQKYIYSKNEELMHQEQILSLLNKNQMEVFHPTYYEDYYIASNKSIPLVLTVHDMIYELFPEYFNPKERDQLCKKKRNTINAANKVIAVSEATKKDIVRLYNISENKIIVIPEANTLVRFNKAFGSPKTDNLPRRFILFVGKRSGYKNFAFMLRSIALILIQTPELYLLCTGDSFSKEEEILIHELNLEKKIHHVRIDLDDNLACLYKNALALLFPSLYEGFGLPILEAMHYGCPVIASNTSSIPEVAGNAAFYIDPRDSYTISSALSKILEDETLRNELREKGIEQEKKYSWDTVAKQTFEVYKSVC